MAADPMTLAEFERETSNALAEARINDRLGRPYLLSDQIVREKIRPLILRLLAGERERCVRECSAEMREAKQEDASPLFIMGAKYCRDRIKNLGDPP